MLHPTFLARFLRDGSTALQCRESGTRYIVAPIGPTPRHDECVTYRDGQPIHTGTRANAVNAIESDAKWSLRNPH
jgi:hypothetical protein